MLNKPTTKQDLIKVLKACEPFAASDKAKVPPLQGVRLYTAAGGKELRGMATDRYSVICVRIDWTGHEFDLFLPGYVVKTLLTALRSAPAVLHVEPQVGALLFTGDSWSYQAPAQDSDRVWQRVERTIRDGHDKANRGDVPVCIDPRRVSQIKGLPGGLRDAGVTFFPTAQMGKPVPFVQGDWAIGVYATMRPSGDKFPTGEWFL